MSPEQKTLVQTTWRQIVPIADIAVGLFYDRLFQIDPSTRDLFAGVDLEKQRSRLVHALALVVGALDRVDELIPTIADLGRQHVAYGVTDRHYDSVGSALIWTLERGLGPAWTAEVKAAWVAAYALLAGIMRDAAGDVAGNEIVAPHRAAA